MQIDHIMSQMEGKNHLQINDFQGPSEFQNLTGKRIWQ